MQTNISTHTHLTKCLQWVVNDFLLSGKCVCIRLWVKGSCISKETLFKFFNTIADPIFSDIAEWIQTYIHTQTLQGIVSIE